MIDTVAWTLAAWVGLMVVLWLHREAVLDKRALEKAGATNGRQIVVRGLVRNQSVRAVVLGVFTLIGVAALMRPVLPDWTDSITTGIRLSLIAGVALLSWDAWMDYMMARRLKSGRISRGEEEEEGDK